MVKNGQLADSSLYFHNRLCVPNDLQLKQNILNKAHNNVYTLHPRRTIMYCDFKQMYWWSRMKREIFEFVSKCLVKAEHQVPFGLFQPIMLTKSAHFIPIRIDFSLDKFVELYVLEIVRLHGVPLSIIYDCDPRFTSRFWGKLHEALGTKLKFSTAFHPQTESQSERVIQILEDMPWCCILSLKVFGKKLFHWLNLLIITVTSRALKWHCTKLCMEGNVELRCTRLS
ncbi:reverse transcriptase [Gossypium australe]|uniref:Reverse transcriptase n=1 Tax=Gossypium australe TaxID=47621 RepID=A0A5B6VCU8_9ROSI|nr:reverse transcriptase [Gossypium australe]